MFYEYGPWTRVYLISASIFFPIQEGKENNQREKDPGYEKHVITIAMNIKF